MRYTLIIFVLLCLTTHVAAQSLQDLSFGEENTLEVATWNVEYFPKSGQSTIDSVQKIILAMDIDVLALQEIDIESSFTQLVNNLPGWEGYHVPGSWPSLAFIYKTSAIEIDSIFEIYTNESNKFPRSPLVMEMKFRGETFIIINNHLKCCGNGILNYNDPNDEEKRRYDANILLDQYIVANYPNDRVIVLGDLNDELTDNTDNNVFQDFIADFTNYKFVDMGIATGSSSDWSYPSWPSHLDHILITNELFVEFANDSSDIQTIKVDQYLSSWSQYDGLISDHRPIALKIQINPNSIGIGGPYTESGSLTIYPNPAAGNVHFYVQNIPDRAIIEIYDMKEQKLAVLDGLEKKSTITWEPEGLAAGIYYVLLRVDNRLRSVQKLVLIK